MKFWIIISLLYTLTNSLAQELNLSEVRELYIEASVEEDKANQLYELTKNSSIESDYKRLTYNAIAILLQSKFTINPIDKIKSFKEGKEQLEMVISQYPEDIELRFLRFCVQDGTPAILDYKLNMEEDSQFIKNNISTSSEELQQFIMPIFKTLNDGRTSYTGR
ncbi:MAG: hypothetical protein ISP71_03360 [Flavobacteriales bacterium]|nr:hypothetical protein [Flavobacteriales bacterium]